MTTDSTSNIIATSENSRESSGSLLDSIRGIFSKKQEEIAVLDDPYGFTEENGAGASIENEHQHRLIANVLSVSNLVAEDVMIPRADIVAIDVEATSEELLAFLTEKTFSRIPVYKETLDDIVGCVNSKDILVCLARGERPVVKDIIRDVMIVSPSLDALDLLLEMRESRKHMALVVDEFGGIDGLITIGDMIEAIVGEIDDEHAEDDEPQLIERADGTILADARVDVSKFEETYGTFLSEEEHEDIDTLGGLVMSLAGRMPTRGELLKHESGLEIEILDADGRRVKRLRVHKLPDPEKDTDSD